MGWIFNENLPPQHLLGFIYVYTKLIKGCCCQRGRQQICQVDAVVGRPGNMF